MQVVNVKHAESAVPPERSAGSAGFSSLLSERRGRQARPGPRLGPADSSARPHLFSRAHLSTCILFFFLSLLFTVLFFLSANSQRASE